MTDDITDMRAVIALGFAGLAVALWIACTFARGGRVGR